jgi:anti-sigma factor RsiW
MAAKARQRHPSEESLTAHYFASPETGDEVAVHLTSCDRCAARYAGLRSALERIHRDGIRDADRVFTPARLAAQRDHIMRKLELVGRAARVIAFPLPTSRFRVAGARSMTTRWIAGAAAAGLLIGLLAGQVLDIRHHRAELVASSRVAMQSSRGIVARREESSVRQPLTETTRRASRPGVPDEAFLSEIDASLSTMRVDGLRALDAMTPRVRDIAVQVK